MLSSENGPARSTKSRFIFPRSGTPTKKFLHRDITMTSGKATLGGAQIVGWDPITQQISSWMFSDNGSYTIEGVWSLEGNLWMVLATPHTARSKNFAIDAGLL